MAPKPMSPARAWGITLTIVGAIGLVVCLIALGELAPPPQQSLVSAASSPAPPSESEISFQLAALGAKELRQAMRDPDSFKLARVLVMPDGAACYEYRARNGFGGMNVSVAVLSPDGTVRSSEAPGFSRAWKQECEGRSGDDKTWEVGLAAGLHGMFSE